MKPAPSASSDMLLGAIGAAFVDRLLATDGEKFIDRVADAICARFELLEPAAAAALLSMTESTLRANHKKWGLDKSTAYGASNPRYFLTQIIERARSRVIAGRRKTAPSEA